MQSMHFSRSWLVYFNREKSSVFPQISNYFLKKKFAPTASLQYWRPQQWYPLLPKGICRTIFGRPPPYFWMRFGVDHQEIQGLSLHTCRPPFEEEALALRTFHRFLITAMARPRVFFDITIGSSSAGRIVMEVSTWNSIYSTVRHTCHRKRDLLLQLLCYA